MDTLGVDWRPVSHKLEIPAKPERVMFELNED
jgi:hypothetical protein